MGEEDRIEIDCGAIVSITGTNYDGRYLLCHSAHRGYNLISMRDGGRWTNPVTIHNGYSMYLDMFVGDSDINQFAIIKLGRDR